jgi:hypothetical protein
LLVPLDDYFIHQTTDSVARPAGGSPIFQERNYFNIHSREGHLLVVCGMGTTPNTDLASAYLIAATSGPDGAQLNWRGVRPISGDRTRMDIGAFAYKIVEPMKHWQITVAPNESGIELDVHWTARHRPWEFEKIWAADAEGRVRHDFAHMHQSGTYQGWVSVEGTRYDVDGWYGVRDRTWGIREDLEFWIWSAVQFPDRTLSLYHFENSSGEVQYSNGGFSRADSTGPAVRILRHEFDLVPGERVPGSGVLQLEEPDGGKSELRFRRLGPLVSYMAPKPVDLEHPYESALGRPENGADRWPNAEYGAAARVHGTIHDSLCEFQLGDETGYGVFELVAVNYAPYGWTSPFDFSASIEAGQYDRG